MAELLKKQVFFFACSPLEELRKAKVCILWCSCADSCVCVCCLSGSGCIARCLLTYWGFVVVVGGLLAVQTTEKELSLFFSISLCVCLRLYMCVRI